jgi:hypothetical protein
MVDPGQIAVQVAQPTTGATNLAAQAVVAPTSAGPTKPTKERLKELLNATWLYLWDNKAWVLLILAFASFVYFNMTRPKAPIGDVPALWNASIKKLGVDPIYPPQEGVRVGDVFLTVAPVRPEVRGFLQDFIVDTFTGRAIKIGHIPLEDAMPLEQSQFELPATQFLANGAMDEKQNGLLSRMSGATAQTSEIRVYDVTFPKVDITQNATSSGWAKWFSADFSDLQTNSIFFNKVQTYAAPYITAFSRLRLFCIEKIECANDKMARILLQHSIGEEVNRTYRATDDVERYAFDIEIFVVSQVFSTRNITFTSNNGWADSLAANAVPAEDETTESTTSGDDVQQKRPGFTYRKSAGTGLTIDAVFQRPLIFAYRRIGITLPRTDPAKENAK